MDKMPEQRIDVHDCETVKTGKAGIGVCTMCRQVTTLSKYGTGSTNGRFWRKAGVGAAKDSVTTKSDRFVQLGGTKEGKRTRAFGRPKFACLPNNSLAGSAARQPIAADATNRFRSKPFSKHPWLWIPALAGMTGESFRTNYRRYRRCCH